MRGLTKNWSVAESSVKAIQAGNDIVLLPPNPDIAVKAIHQSVLKGDIPMKRIEESVKKVLLAKYCLGLHKNKLIDLDEIAHNVNTEYNNTVAAKIAQKSITVLKNDQIIPLSKSGDKKILCLTVSDNSDASTGSQFERGLSSRLKGAEFMKIDTRTTDVEFDKIYQKCRQVDLIILPSYLRVRSYSGSVSFNKQQKKYIDSIYALNKPVFMISFGNPYIISDYPQSKAYLTGYGDAPVTIEAGIKAIFGEAAISGKLPINIPDLYKIGDGLEIPKTALEESNPSQLGLKENTFDIIDEMMTKATEDSVFPGAALLIAKDSKIFYNKTFGAYTYSPDAKQVTTRTLFDLASVTKVIATTNAAMKLVDEGKLELEEFVSKYLPDFSSNGKDRIKIKNLLLHNSGLPPFKLFYKMCDSPKTIMDSIYAASLVFKPGDSTLYSDIGMITMGKVIEKITGKALDLFLSETFFKPLGLNSTMFNPNQNLKDYCAPTENDDYWRMKLVQGSVHDENAQALGGVAGHAGLFSNTADLAVILQLLLNKGTYDGKKYLSEKVISNFLTPVDRKTNRAFGWGLKSLDGNSSAGKKFSDNSYGHTGFTGTSVWTDPDRNLFVILLTNRVHPTRKNNKLSEFRPLLHDKIIDCLENPKNKFNN